MAILEEIDSGMESLKEGDSKSTSPELPPGAKWAHELDDDDEDFEDETLFERLVGLTEMFPEKLVSGTKNAASWSTSAVKALYGFGRSATWVVFSSSLILFAPLVFEIERVRIQESQKAHQRQMLLGPSAAMGGGGGGGMPPMPGMSMPPPPTR